MYLKHNRLYNTHNICVVRVYTEFKWKDISLYLKSGVSEVGYM